MTSSELVLYRVIASNRYVCSHCAGISTKISGELHTESQQWPLAAELDEQLPVEAQYAQSTHLESF